MILNRYYFSYKYCCCREKTQKLTFFFLMHPNVTTQLTFNDSSNQDDFFKWRGFYSDPDLFIDRKKNVIGA
jgi:hypothetical protein